MIEKVSLSSELKNIYVFTIRLFGIRPGVLHDLILKFFFYSFFFSAWRLLYTKNR